MEGHRVRRRQALALAATASLTLIGCGSASDGAGNDPATTAAPTITESPAPETTEKVSTPCSEAIIGGEIFDEDMVAECMQISGVASTACPDGSMVGLIDVSGTPLVVHAGASAEPVDDTVAKPLTDQPPHRYDVDEAKLLDRCE